MKKTTKRIVIGVAAFVAVICGLSSLVVTKENEYTLIMRFGKINSIKTEAGLSFKVPFLDIMNYRTGEHSSLQRFIRIE